MKKLSCHNAIIYVFDEEIGQKKAKSFFMGVWLFLFYCLFKESEKW